MGKGMPPNAQRPTAQPGTSACPFLFFLPAARSITPAVHFRLWMLHFAHLVHLIQSSSPLAKGVSWVICPTNQVRRGVRGGSPTKSTQASHKRPQAAV